MTPGASKKRNRNRLSLMSRTLLLILYLFLLAPQCHSHFYSVANFYRFTTRQNGVQITSTKAEVEHVVHIKVKHLRLDKRFRNTNTYHYLPLQVESEYTYANPVISRNKEFPPFINLYNSTHLRSRSLRGPPCA